MDLNGYSGFSPVLNCQRSSGSSGDCFHFYTVAFIHSAILSKTDLKFRASANVLYERCCTPRFVIQRSFSFVNERGRSEQQPTVTTQKVSPLLNLKKISQKLRILLDWSLFWKVHISQ